MSIKHKFSPVCSKDVLSYEYNGDIITATHEKYQESFINDDGKLISAPPVITRDTFDFTGFPDGEADISSIQTKLPINPFVSAKRVNGTLEVILINYHNINASEKERFPQWEVIE